MDKVVQGPLSDHAPYFAEMTRLQTTRSVQENTQILMHYIRVEGQSALLISGRKVIGSLVMLPIHRLPEGVSFAQRLGIDAETAVLPSMFYVDPEHRGKGLAHVLREHALSYAATSGKKIELIYGYETGVCLSWFIANKKHTDTGLKDRSGYPVLTLKLNKTNIN